MTDFDLQHARTVAQNSLSLHDVSMMLHAACDEIERLRKKVDASRREYDECRLELLDLQRTFRGGP